MNLPKENRLSSKDLAFLKNIPADKLATSSLLRLKFYKRDTPKFVFIVGKRYLSKASSRNALRRRAKSVIFDKLKSGSLLIGYYVFIVKFEFKNFENYEKISTEIDQVLSKIS